MLEASSVCIAATVFLIVLQASMKLDGGVRFDAFEGRDAMLVLSVAFMALGSYLFRLSWRSQVKRQPAEVAEPALEESAEVAHSRPERETTFISPMSEDESRLYEMISESGGEMLQMHIVSSKKFSKAKVTRLLDKLEKRGLVVRERQGMTNRIRLIR